eukprot:jgi/Tetstr1/454660/TSEL_041550.t1
MHVTGTLRSHPYCWLGPTHGTAPLCFALATTARARAATGGGPSSPAGCRRPCHLPAANQRGAPFLIQLLQPGRHGGCRRADQSQFSGAAASGSGAERQGREGRGRRGRARCGRGSSG